MLYKTKIRYGQLRHIGDFYTETSELNLQEKVVVGSERGEDVGEVLTNPKGPCGCEGACSKILRKLTPEDSEKLKEIKEEKGPEAFAFCKEKIKEKNLPMKLTTVEHLLDGKKIIFYFVAKERVDFRELVRDLAKKYHTRIEMRQIGVRDEARLLAQYQHCGRELCCRSFLKRLDPVTMKMAKNQRATLDPYKISGRCGRLMCCLRYENDVYEELKSKLPRKGSTVYTSKGIGKVIDFEILRQKVTIQTEDQCIHTVDSKDIQKIERTSQPLE
ncbi:MAG TPA: PSP1 domain-containing protein [Candidatus Hypogeohydataceae bacterium YC41]